MSPRGSLLPRWRIWNTRIFTASVSGPGGQTAGADGVAQMPDAQQGV